MSRERIESGGIEKDIWIGRGRDYYGVVRPLGSNETHYLRFSVEEAKVAVKMLQGEIERAEKESGQ